MLITIIVPCFNQGRFLNETLQSIYEQTYTNWECLIIDDGSIDNSTEIAKQWQDKDNRFIYLYQENKGVSAARNKALKLAKGEWIQFLDADDFLEPNKIEFSLKTYNKDPNINFIVTNFRHFTINTNKTTEPFCQLKEEVFSLESLIYRWNDSFSLPIHCVLFKRELIENVFFPETLTAQEDWFFWVSVFKKNPICYFIDKPLVLYRTHKESRIKSKSIKNDQLEVYRIFESILTKKEYSRLSEVLLERSLKKAEIAGTNLKALKNSNTYQAGRMIKKILRGLGLLKVGRWIFQYVRTFKKPTH